MQPIFAILANAGVDVVLNGHAHAYERFPPMRADATPDPNGMRVFIVGTGGSSLSSFGDGAVKSDVRDDGSHGVLRLVLRDGSYAWSFEPIDGDSFHDAGEGACHD
jgi:hypothetical protein